MRRDSGIIKPSRPVTGAGEGGRGEEGMINDITPTKEVHRGCPKVAREKHII